MRKKYMKFGPDAVITAGAPPAKKKEGEQPDETKSDDDEDSELKAIQRVADKIEEFKTLLGEKADVAKFEAVQKEIESLQKGIETMKSSEVTKAIESINKTASEVYGQVLKFMSDIADAQKEQNGLGLPTAGPVVKSEEVKAFVDSIFEGTRKRSAQVGAPRVTVKAPETFGVGVTYVSGTDQSAFTGRFVDPNLNVRKRKRNLILDNFQIQTIGVPTLVYLEKVEVGDTNTTSGDPGHANWIVSGASKPQRSFRVKSGQVEAKKVAIYGRIEDKLLRDVPSFENWIRQDFTDEMREKINDGLLNNNPSVNANAPLGLKQNAIQYSVTPAFNQTVFAPNYIDAIIAAIASMADKEEDPGLVFVSSDVFYAIQNLKDSTGKYQNSNLVYTNNLGELFIAGVKVVWADRIDVPSTNFLLISNDLGFKIFAYGPMIIEKGLNGEDFREDKTSFRGYQEFVTYIASNRVNSVMYDTFANVFTAITLPDAES